MRIWHTGVKFLAFNKTLNEMRRKEEWVTKNAPLVVSCEVNLRSLCIFSDFHKNMNLIPT